MESDPVLFHHLHQILTVLNFSLQLAQINVGRVPRQAARNAVRTDSVFTYYILLERMRMFISTTRLSDQQESPRSAGQLLKVVRV